MRCGNNSADSVSNGKIELYKRGFNRRRAVICSRKNMRMEIYYVCAFYTDNVIFLLQGPVPRYRIYRICRICRICRIYHPYL